MTSQQCPCLKDLTHREQLPAFSGLRPLRLLGKILLDVPQKFGAVASQFDVSDSFDCAHLLLIFRRVFTEFP